MLWNLLILSGNHFKTYSLLCELVRVNLFVVKTFANPAGVLCELAVASVRAVNHACL